MIQIFFIGSSSIYGVGGENGGYADIIKQALHKKMFEVGGVGEKYEVYNFGKSGATTNFVIETFPELLKQYGHGGKIITIVNVGGNNAKAENEPDNFVSTIDEYTEQMTQLLDLLNKCSSRVIAVGSGYYDESKVSPKANPLTGGKSYFSNERSGKFQQRFKELCDEKEITFIDVGIGEKEWLDKYIYNDGLHANNAGHELISSKILKELEKELE
jgi:lysophospholipase L1-like esterase